MKKFTVRFPGTIFTLIIIATLFLFTSLYGQRQQYSSSEFIRSAEIQMGEYGISPIFIRFKEGNQPTAHTFFSEYKKSFSQFSSSENEPRLLRPFKDNLGETHYRYNQYYKGVQVLGAQFILHEKNGFIRSANGYFIHGINTNVHPVLSVNDALARAIGHIGAEKYMWENKANEIFLKNEQKDPNATFYPQGDLKLTTGGEELRNENVKLVYRFDIYADVPRRRDYVDVNAVTGEIVNVISRIQDGDVPGSGTSSYNGLVTMTVDEVVAGSNYRLQEHTTRAADVETYNMLNGTNYFAAIDFTSTSANGTWDPVGVSCHWGAESTYDYYFNDHGRNSFDNVGGAILSYAHRGVNYNNAFWDGTRMTYGDGDGVIFTPLVCLDVVGHEITHGVTEYSANLVYQDEPGALNESFSDIFGTAVEFYMEGTGGDWAIGEDIYIPDPVNGIRQMADPNITDQPDTYFGNFWAPLGGPDHGGVHTNSGVQNYWFYLVSDGGNGVNDNGDSYNITGIGIDKAADIAYRNLTVYLGVNSQYADARTGAIDAATDLYGAGSSEVQTVMDAWDAVGVYEPVPPEGVLVWEGVFGGQDYSGAYINSFLTGAAFSTHYTYVFPPTLIGYDAVFLSFGNYSNNYTPFSDIMASAVQAYLEAGGKCYLEGGDALGFNQQGNTALQNLFGLSSSDDGSTNIIDGLAGQPGAITNGMLFTSSNQVGNGYIDIFTPNTGTVALNESAYGEVAVQNVGGFGQKTFCFSYALAELVDGSSPSTKNDLMTAIVNFLDGGPPPFPPDISVTPTTFTLNVPIGGNDIGTLTISNIAPTGSQNLIWDIIDQEARLTLSDRSKTSIQLNNNEKQGNQVLSGKNITDILEGDCPWLSANPTNGTIPAGGNQNVIVTVDATGLAAGTYNCSLAINSNDPVEPTVTVLVELNVLPQVVDFSVDFLVFDNCANNSHPLIFGTAPGATDCYDPGLDQLAPPPPPPGAFDCRFISCDEHFFKDFRGTNPDVERIWNVYYESSSECYPVSFSWEPAELPADGYFHLVDPIYGNLVNVNMRTTNNFTDLLDLGYLQIKYNYEILSNFNLAEGWNLLSLPVDVANNNYLVLFPNANQGTLYGYSEGYFTLETVGTCAGYWLKFPASEVAEVYGSDRTECVIALDAGWNIIGGPNCNVPLSNVGDPGGIMIPGTLYGYSGGYFTATSIDVTEGYWIKANASGTITVSCGTPPINNVKNLTISPETLTDFCNIDISDGSNAGQTLYFNGKLDKNVSIESFSMPPVPPQGSFDARLVGDYRLTESDEVSIQLQATDYPVSIMITNLNSNEGYVLVEIANGVEVGTQKIAEGSEIIIRNEEVTMLKITKKQSLPTTYNLEQNYPNPFNPTTIIKFSLPEAANVTLTIYNTLGQKVDEIVNTSLEAGWYSYRWDASNVATGIYIYELRTDKFISVKKMILLK